MEREDVKECSESQGFKDRQETLSQVNQESQDLTESAEPMDFRDSQELKDHEESQLH